jgi:hypothetical protein
MAARDSGHADELLDTKNRGQNSPLVSAAALSPVLLHRRGKPFEFFVR